MAIANGHQICSKPLVKIPQHIGSDGADVGGKETFKRKVNLFRTILLLELTDRRRIGCRSAPTSGVPIRKWKAAESRSAWKILTIISPPVY